MGCRQREVYRFQTDNLVSNVAWSNEASDSLLLSLSTINNQLPTDHQAQIVELKSLDYDESIDPLANISYPYPITKILWAPPVLASSKSTPNLIAINADKLSILALGESRDYHACDQNKSNGYKKLLLDLRCSLSNCDQEETRRAPTTSFDWNEIDPSLIITSSVDSKCRLWNIEVDRISDEINSRIKNQVVAYDHQVYDVSFARLGSGREVFASVGGDGCLKLFDTRDLPHGRLLYETPKVKPTSSRTPLVRVECNRVNPHLIATFGLDSSNIIVVDIRSPLAPVCLLTNHKNHVNSICWNSNSANQLCSGSSDKTALIWDLTRLPSPIDEPILCYQARGEINAISWSNTCQHWISIGYDNYLELLLI